MWRRLGSKGILLAGLLLLAGCMPSRFVARRFAQAPNSYPRWFAPEPRVVFDYRDGLVTNFPLRHLAVAVPPARIAHRVVPPADYRLEVRTTNWVEHGLQKARFDFDATVPAPPPNGVRKGTVFLLHGYALDLETMVPWALWLGERGWTAVLVDLRGHGQSTGKQVGFGPLEASDLDRLLADLDARGPLPRPIVALGNSYGASLALRWAASNPGVDSAVAIAPYAELVPTIDRLRGDYVPWMPRRWVVAGARQLPRVLGQPPGELDTTTPLARRAVPALLLAGGADVIAPPGEVGRLRCAAGPGSRLHVVPGASHESLPFRFPELAEVVGQWLDGRGERQ